MIDVHIYLVGIPVNLALSKIEDVLIKVVVILTLGNEIWIIINCTVFSNFTLVAYLNKDIGTFVKKLKKNRSYLLD